MSCFSSMGYKQTKLAPLASSFVLVFFSEELVGFHRNRKILMFNFCTENQIPLNSEGGGMKGSSPPQLLLKEGWLNKEGAKVKNWKKRYYKLYPTRIEYYKKTIPFTDSMVWTFVSLLKIKAEQTEKTKHLDTQRNNWFSRHIDSHNIAGGMGRPKVHLFVDWAKARIFYQCREWRRKIWMDWSDYRYPWKISRHSLT